MPRLASRLCVLRPSRSLAALALLLVSASPIGVASAQTAPPLAAPQSATPQQGAAPQPGAMLQQGAPQPGPMPQQGAPPPSAPPQQGATPPGAMPPGAMPPGAMPPGAMPPGAMPPGAMPPGAMPPGAMPQQGAPQAGAAPHTYTPPGGAQAWIYTQAPYYGYGKPYVPPPKEPFSQGAAIAGAVMTIGGLAALIAGSVVTAVSHGRVDVYCDGPALCAQVDDPKLAQPGMALMIVGGVATAVGIPLWFYGGRLVPVRKPDAAPTAGAMAAPVLRIGAGSASLSLRF